MPIVRKPPFSGQTFLGRLRWESFDHRTLHWWTVTTIQLPVFDQPHRFWPGFRRL